MCGKVTSKATRKCSPWVEFTIRRSTTSTWPRVEHTSTRSRAAINGLYLRGISPSRGPPLYLGSRQRISSEHHYVAKPAQKVVCYGPSLLGNYWDPTFAKLPTFR